MACMLGYNSRIPVWREEDFFEWVLSSSQLNSRDLFTSGLQAYTVGSLCGESSQWFLYYCVLFLVCNFLLLGIGRGLCSCFASALPLTHSPTHSNILILSDCLSWGNACSLASNSIFSFSFSPSMFNRFWIFCHLFRDSVSCRSSWPWTPNLKWSSILSFFSRDSWHASLCLAYYFWSIFYVKICRTVWSCPLLPLGAGDQIYGFVNAWLVLLQLNCIHSPWFLEGGSYYNSGWTCDLPVWNADIADVGYQDLSVSNSLLSTCFFFTFE